MNYDNTIVQNLAIGFWQHWATHWPLLETCQCGALRAGGGERTCHHVIVTAGSCQLSVCSCNHSTLWLCTNDNGRLVNRTSTWTACIEFLTIVINIIHFDQYFISRSNRYFWISVVSPDVNVNVKFYAIWSWQRNVMNFAEQIISFLLECSLHLSLFCVKYVDFFKFYQ